MCTYAYNGAASTPAQLHAALPLDRFECADRKIGLRVRHRQDSWAIRMGEVVMAAFRADQIPALRFDCLNDILALQISPIARMLVRPAAPTITWSCTVTFMCRPASTRSRVRRMSC